MTKNEFRKAAVATGKVNWVKYSGKTKTFYVNCRDSHVIDELEPLVKNSDFKVKFG